jgi:hypothetical protein
MMELRVAGAGHISDTLGNPASVPFSLLLAGPNQPYIIRASMV